MNDNLRRYCAIQKALKSLRPTEPKGNVARHLNTLAMLIAGIVGSRKCHLPAVAQKVPSGSKPQSRVRKMERWLTNKTRDHAPYYLPYVQTLLANLPPSPLIVVMDGSEAGRDCVLLSVNVVYKKRALPLCWLVVKGKKGHLAEAIHIACIRKAVAEHHHLRIHLRVRRGIAEAQCPQNPKSRKSRKSCTCLQNEKSPFHQQLTKPIANANRGII